VITIVLAIVLGPVLWLAGAILFDAVHWLLHVMHGSRFGLLRALAYPHQIHHQWIDRQLVTHLEFRVANIFCHIIPEYLTQLAFTALVALTLPLPFAIVVGSLQTLVFLAVLYFRGQDINHRPAPRIDAYPPGWTTPPAYHALHHAWPDAYFSAYTKCIDWIVGGATQIESRSFAWVGDHSAMERAVGSEIERLGGQLSASRGVSSASDADVLLIGAASSQLQEIVESHIDQTRERRLPPEIWAFRHDPDAPLARHYMKDARVGFRLLLVPDPDAPSISEVARRDAARSALFWIRRDAHCVSLAASAGRNAVKRFRRTSPEPPRGAELVKSRMEYVS
jgi:hypothetical protein